MKNALLAAALILPWLLLAFQSWLLYQLLRQQGRVLLAVDDLGDRIELLETGAGDDDAGDYPETLAVGSPAPEFTLPDLHGNEKSLADFLGDPLVVTFFDLACGYCRRMAPELGQLPEGAHRVLLVSRGDVDEHRRLAEEHGWRCDVVLDQNRDVAKAYLFQGTPTGYLLSADGRIASELRLGAEAMLALTRSAAVDTNGDGQHAATNSAATSTGTARTGPAVRDLSTSRINRKGLRAGVPAPEFTLPDLDGVGRSLRDLRGRQVLLVFSDTDCAPCDELAPKLAELAAERSDDGLAVLMVSRGSPEANRTKADEHGLEFPVLLQRSWEVSKKYGIFTTPVGYLIDEDGILARDVAIGEGAILALPLEPE